MVLFCLTAHAASDQPLPIEDDSAKLVEAPGQPSKIIFGDGREATLMVSKPGTSQFKTPFKITENGCAPSAPAPHCSYNFTVNRIVANFIWTKNPDATRLGKPLDLVYPNNPRQTIENEGVTYSHYTKLARPQIPNDIPSDILQCDRWDWLPASQQNSENVVMKIWSGEVMGNNSETDLNENQTFFSYSDISWSREGSVLKLKNIKRMSTTILLPPLTDTSMIVMENQGQECQISAASSLTALLATQRIPTPPITEVAPASLRARQLTGLYFSLKYALNDGYYKPGKVIQ
jgi:hypothetical protein